MKKIMMALALMGFVLSGADAQTRNCNVKKVKAKKVVRLNRKPMHIAKTGNTYQVCREQGGYYSCCIYKNATATKW